LSHDEALLSRILHLREVEKLSVRQIGKELAISRHKVTRVLQGAGSATRALPRPGILESYRQLIAEWYKQRPFLRADQVYEWLQSYGFKGSYQSVVKFTAEYRQRRREAYHALVFLPGQEAQIDWFFFDSLATGKVAGFLYVLAYSRYAWGRFYPRSTFEFFLDGHLECFKHLGGLAHCHRYDNLKSVCLRRYPEVEYNPQFLDFARHYGFEIYLCQPGQGNQKGRVGRPIRDIRGFLYAGTFKDRDDLNCQFVQYLHKRNNRVHRSTNKTPKELLACEPLLKLPINPYPALRTVAGVSITKTALVDFDNNKYSVPDQWAGKPAEITAEPKTIEIWSGNKKIAVHQRCFDKKRTIENPLHRERLLTRTSPEFKMQRIYQLIRGMDKGLQTFLERQEDEPAQRSAAYCLFQLLKSHSKQMLLSAVRELNDMNCSKIKALMSLLALPQPRQGDRLWPKRSDLLTLDYEERSLTDYDGLT
jgi:transposase